MNLRESVLVDSRHKNDFHCQALDSQFWTDRYIRQGIETIFHLFVCNGHQILQEKHKKKLDRITLYDVEQLMDEFDCKNPKWLNSLLFLFPRWPTNNLQLDLFRHVDDSVVYMYHIVSK